MKVIELMGMPKAGKGSLIKRLLEKLDKKGYLVQQVPDPGDALTLLNREISAERVKRYFNYTLGKLFELADSSRAEIVLVHRGIWDNLAFVEALQFIGRLKKREAEKLSQIFRYFADKEDKVVLVTVPAEVSYSRTRVHPEEDISSYRHPSASLEFLRALEKAYREVGLQLPKGTVVLDGTKNIEDNLQIILGEITSLLPPREEKLPNDLVSLMGNRSGDCPFSETAPAAARESRLKATNYLFSLAKEDLRSWARCLREVIAFVLGGRNGDVKKDVRKLEKV